MERSSATGLVLLTRPDLSIQNVQTVYLIVRCPTLAPDVTQFVGLPASFFEKDFLGEFYLVAENSDVPLGNGQQPAVDGENLRPALRHDDLHHAGHQGGHERLVSRQNADVALACAGDDVDDIALHDHLVRGDDLQLQRLIFHAHRSFCILSQFARTSSMPPTLKKACSAMWSTSPRQIIEKPSMVSATGTVEPGMFVNFSAM